MLLDHSISDVPILPLPGVSPLPWYAVRTRSNFEKKVHTILSGKGYVSFLPLCRVRRQWSDRVVVSYRPLFPGYLFCRLNLNFRTPVLSIPGVVEILGKREDGALSQAEIDAIRQTQGCELEAEPHPFTTAGRKVRVVGGALSGLDGFIVSQRSSTRVIISFEMLQRSIGIELDPSFLEVMTGE